MNRKEIKKLLAGVGIAGLLTGLTINTSPGTARAGSGWSGGTGAGGAGMQQGGGSGWSGTPGTGGTGMEHEMGTEQGQQVDDPAISDEEMNKQMMEKDKETKEGETPQEWFNYRI